MLVADPFEMVEPVEKQRDASRRAPTARVGWVPAVGEPQRGLAGSSEAAAIVLVGCRVSRGFCFREHPFPYSSRQGGGRTR